MIRWLLNLFLSKRCFVCGQELPMREIDFCCSGCEPLVEASRIGSKKCERCGRGLSYMYNSTVCSSCNKHSYAFDGAISVFYYEGHIKDAVHRMKFSKKPHLAAVFGSYINGVIPSMKFDYIVYPPVNRKTFYKRGYNQAELMAQELSKLTGIPVLKNALRKEKQNEVQSRMSGKERFRNVSGAFSVSRKAGEKLCGKRLLLLDDVFTTGATVSECAKMLKKQKASFVFVATLASTREM